MNKKSLFSNLRWILFVSRRFSSVDRKGQGKHTDLFSTIGICFGVMALITVMSVMNGFQLSYIDSILEISSYHVQVRNVEYPKEFLSWCNSEKNILCAVPFKEAQGLVIGNSTKQTAAIIRAVPSDVCFQDFSFNDELKIISGAFDINDEKSIVLGSDLARMLGLRVGSTLNVFALSGGKDVSLVSEDRNFTVTGIFTCGYSDINSSYCFVSEEAGNLYFGADCPVTYGIKLKNSSLDMEYVSKILRNFNNVNAESWRNYNRSFFGTLKMEKNIMFLLILLIFLVVAVNIYNGMRRMVFERNEEIAILSAFGAEKKHVLSVFTLKGFLIGLKGSLSGLLCGLLISFNMDKVFSFISKLYYYIELLGTRIFNPEYAIYVVENPMFKLYSNISCRVNPGEVIFISLFGLLSASFAAFFAGRKIMTFSITEVLRDE